MLLCGMQETVITPPAGRKIPGQYREKISTGVLDDLYAKAAVFDNGAQACAILAVDICALSAGRAAEIRKLASRLTGMEERSILVAATHTHTGGPCALWPGLYEPDGEYLDFVVQRGAQAVADAYRSRRPARAGGGTGSEGRISFHRRYRMKDGTVRTNPGLRNRDIVRPDGPIDPDVAVIRIDGEDGHPMGVITNFACHLDCVGGTMFSGDYAGSLSGAVKTALGDAAVSLFLAGACGNINHIDFMSDDPIRKEHWKWMGEVLAGDVLAIRGGIGPSGDFPVRLEAGTLTERRRLPSRSDMDFMDRALSRPEEQLTDFDWWRAMQLKLIASDPRWADPADLELQAVRLGDTLLMTVPAELFTEYGIELKRGCGFKNAMVSTLTNGMFGYVPTPEALEAGGYEATIAYTSCLTAEAGERIVNALRSLSTRLRE